MRSKRLKPLILCITAILVMLATTLSTASATSSSFGFVSIGDSSQATFGGVFVSNFTSPADIGTINQISVYLATGGTSAKAVIYSDNNGVPDALLTQSSNVTIDGTSGKWVNFDTSYVGKPNTTYWLGILFSSAGTYYYASGIVGRSLYSSPATEAPSTYAIGTANPNETLSVNAVYTAATSSPLPNDQSSSWVQTALLIIAVTGIVIAAILVGLFIKGKKTIKR